MHQPVSEIDPLTDVLVINDLQNDFFRYGNLPTLGADDMVYLTDFFASRFFKLDHVYFFGHRHSRSLFPERTPAAFVKHAVVTDPVIFTTVLDDGSIVREVGEGYSHGSAMHPGIGDLYNAHWSKGRGFIRVFRRECPLLGSQFSVFDVLRLDAHASRDGVRRIFFAGLHLEYCIANEVSYLLKTNVFREIVILEDLVRPCLPSVFQETKEKLQAAGARFVMSAKVFPLR